MFCGAIGNVVVIGSGTEHVTTANVCGIEKIAIVDNVNLTNTLSQVDFFILFTTVSHLA